MPLTVPRAAARKKLRSEKYTTNAGLLNKTRSSGGCVGSGTIQNTAISTAPPAHSNNTAPSGARMTTDSEAIWNNEPRMFEVMNVLVGEDVQQRS